MIKIGVAQATLILDALSKAKRDQEALIDAWTPRYEKPAGDARKIIRSIAAQIKSYDQLKASLLKKLRIERERCAKG